MLELAPWLFNDPDFKEKLIQGLEPEIGQPESPTPPKDVIAGSYGEEDAEMWIQQFREAVEEPTKPHSAAGIAVTAGWPAHENHEAAARGAGFGSPF